MEVLKHILLMKYIVVIINETVVGVFDNCDFAVELNSNNLNLPEDIPLPGMMMEVPYVVLADAAFPAQKHILKPYPTRDLTREQRIYNYRISRARRTVENAFGILVNRFRVLLNPINLSRDKVVLITQACCALHNFIKIECAEDPKADNKNAENATLRNITRETPVLHNVRYNNGRPSNRYIAIREQFKDYFNNHGAVPWQDDKV